MELVPNYGSCYRLREGVKLWFDGSDSVAQKRLSVDGVGGDELEDMMFGDLFEKGPLDTGIYLNRRY